MKQFWTAVLALLLALTACGCDQQEDPPASAGDTGSIPQHDTEELQPMELTIEESEQCYRVIFADPRDMIYVSDTQATANGAVFHGVLTTETGLLVRSLEVSTPGQLLSSGGDEVAGALGLDAACRVQDTNCYVLSVEEGEESRQVLKIRDETYDISPLEGVHWLFSWEDGLLLVSLDGQICPVSLSGSLGTPTDLGVEVRRACQSESGTILLMSQGEAPAFYAIHPGDPAAERLCAVPEALEGTQLLSGEKWGYDLMAYDDTALYGWNFGEETLMELLRFETVSLSGSRTVALACLDGETLVGVFRPMDGSAYRVFFLFQSETPMEKITLTIAGITEPMVMQNLMAEFGQMYPEYHAEFVDYQAEYGDQALTQLLMDLQGENCPDVLILNGLPYEALAKRELLTDLNLYLRGGKALQKEDLLPSLVAALETEDGALYRLPQSFSLETAVARQSVVGEESSWDFETFSAIADQMPEDCAVFSQRDPAAVLTNVLFYAYARLVDEDAGTANFDSPLFRGWLSLLKELQDAPPPESESSEEALATGEILLLPVSISSAGQYDELSQALGDDLVAVGYPDGGVASFYLRNPVAIPANAKETRAAWAFLQQMVSASYQNFYSGWLSTNESIEETMAEAEAQGVRPESIAAVEALLQSADQAVYYNEDVTNIVLEETAPFFDGAISQDEAIGRIQERVGLYLDEQ